MNTDVSVICSGMPMDLNLRWRKMEPLAMGRYWSF